VLTDLRIAATSKNDQRGKKYYVNKPTVAHKKASSRTNDVCVIACMHDDKDERTRKAG
jgi:hypothetical protein